MRYGESSNYSQRSGHNSGHNLGKTATLNEAIDLLSTIADGDFVSSVPTEGIGSGSSIQVLQGEQVLRLAQSSFRTILNYFKDFYKKEVDGTHTPHLVERVTAIMAIVTRAAKRFENFSKIVQNQNVPTIRQTVEFQELLTFYQRKIVPIASQQVVTEKIIQLPIHAVVTPQSSEERKIEKLFVSLESLKNDADYELLLIRKEDGSRFFNPRLVKNMQLIANFSDQEAESELNSTFFELQNSQARSTASTLVLKHWEDIDRFIKEIAHSYHHDLANLLYNAIIALMRAAARPNALVQKPSKGAAHYFANFLHFMRAIVSSHEYQDISIRAEKHEVKIDQIIYYLVSRFLFLLFHDTCICKELVNFINDTVVTNKNTKNMRLSDILMRNHEICLQMSKSYTASAFIQLLEAVEDSNIHGYDPFLLQNLPIHFFDLQDHGGIISLIRMPTPTVQERMHTARIIQEYKSFLHCSSKMAESGRQLLFNFQDRTSWREFSRCQAIENIQNNPELHPLLVVVTQNKESDFYNQKGEYQEIHQAEKFIEQLLEQIKSENCGCFYPKSIAQELFPQFVQNLASAILNVFFTSRNVLSRQNRLDFIELFYLFMQLKIIEVSGARNINFCCKDGIDISSPNIVELFLLIKLINNRPLSIQEGQYVNALLFGIPLISRGRTLFAHRFSRLHSLLRTVEAVIDEQGAVPFEQLIAKTITPLFDTKILSFSRGHTSEGSHRQ